MLKLRRGGVRAAGVVEGARLCAYERSPALDPPMGSGAAHTGRGQLLEAAGRCCSLHPPMQRGGCAPGLLLTPAPQQCAAHVSGHGLARSASTIQKAF